MTTSHHAVKLRVDAMQVGDSMEQPSIVTNTYSSATESDSEPRATVGQAGDTLPTSISCTCLNTTQDLLMLTCNYCSQQQHAACYQPSL